MTHKPSPFFSHQKTPHLNKIIQEISHKLNILNIPLIKAQHFTNENLQHLQYLHQIVMKNKSFSPSQMHPIPHELPPL
ncbi:DUF1128 family protein, partial [Bacillus licheniformis]|uniref:DUF1128 family protein n=1 Tax=Bacillus licheniformis TaxID=1402 RepID=UPI0011A22DCB